MTTRLLLYTAPPGDANEIATTGARVKTSADATEMPQTASRPHGMR